MLVTPANVVMFGWLALELFSVPYNTALALPIVAAFTVAAIIVPELVIAAVCVAQLTVNPVNVPTVVKLLAVTVLFKVVPVNVSAGATTTALAL